MAQPVRLSYKIGMQCNAHDQRLRPGLLQHFVKIVDDHVRKLRRAVLARHDGGNVVGLLWVWDRQKPPRAGLHPDRLIVHTPVEGIAVTRLGQKIGRIDTFSNPR